MGRSGSGAAVAVRRNRARPWVFVPLEQCREVETSAIARIAEARQAAAALSLELDAALVEAWRLRVAYEGVARALGVSRATAHRMTVRALERLHGGAPL